MATVRGMSMEELQAHVTVPGATGYSPVPVGDIVQGLAEFARSNADSMGFTSSGLSDPRNAQHGHALSESARAGAQAFRAP